MTNQRHQDQQQSSIVLPLIVAALVGIFASGCATLFSDTHEPVVIDSSPQGAVVELDGNEIGTTPLMINLSSDESYQVSVALNDQQRQVQTISSGIGAGWVILDILAGFVPVVIDAATGAWYTLDTDQLFFSFDSTGSQPPPSHTTGRVDIE